MFRRREPQRKPHPDPGVELQLQEILDLRAAITRWAGLIETYRREIMRFSSEMRTETNKDRIKLYGDQTEGLDAKIRSAEASITDVHEQIRERTAKLSPSDLAWL